MLSFMSFVFVARVCHSWSIGGTVVRVKDAAMMFQISWIAVQIVGDEPNRTSSATEGILASLQHFLNFHLYP